MPLATLADAADLEQWSNLRSAQDRLPQLIRRLVHATTPKLSHAAFAAGEGVQLGGWDGVVLAEEGSAFVPDGSSGWELGTTKKIRVKADSDFEKRTKDPHGADRQRTTFIFVTSRRWRDKGSWSRETASSSDWREVRAYDADNLHEWLELAPAVHLWFSILIGKHPEGAEDIETVWRDWSEATSPVLDADLTIAGRIAQRDAITEWLGKSEVSLAAVRGASPEESMAFFAAVVENLPETVREEFRSRIIVVRDLVTWTRLVAADPPLLLVPAFDVGDLISRATRAGHRVLLPLGPADPKQTGEIALPRAHRDVIEKALLETGLSEDRARELAAIGRRSLLSLRRAIALARAVQMPKWATPEFARSVLPALLAGKWDEGTDGDREALAELGNSSPAEVHAALTRWLNESDPPVRRTARAWYLVSKKDAWELVGKHLPRDDLDRFRKVATGALSTPDPKYDLEPGQRWMASVYGKIPRYSSLLRAGIADTLAIMASLGDGATGDLRWDVAMVARRIAREVFEAARGDWTIWASLSDVLPSLAEAAPNEFLDAIEAGLDGDDPPVLRLFSEKLDFMHSSSHPAVLWALETVAWNPRYLPRASLILAQLMCGEKEKQNGNRPINSLRAAFLGWCPQTAATLDERLEVLDLLREREPDAAWELMAQLLPHPGSHGQYSARPNWRDWAPEQTQNIPPDYGRSVSEVVRRMIADVGTNGDRWQTLVHAFGRLARPEHEALVAALRIVAMQAMPNGDRQRIWNAIREVVGRYRSAPDGRSPLGSKYLEELESLYRQFEPGEPNERFAWLFANRPMPIEGRDLDYRAHNAAVWRKREEAVKTVFEARGLRGLIAFAQSTERPGDVGLATARGDLELDMSDELELLRKGFVTGDAHLLSLARGLFAGRVEQRGREWGEEFLKKVAPTWPARAVGEAMSFLPTDEGTWKLAADMGQSVEEEYWRVVPNFRVAENNTTDAVRHLLHHRRPFTAIELLCFNKSAAGDTQLIAETLEIAARTPPSDDPISGSLSYEIGELLGTLTASAEAGRIDEERLAHLELLFLPVVDSQERSPTTLHRQLARNPELFVEAVTLAFREEGEAPNEASDDEVYRARLAHELLQSWRSVPGALPGGGVDANVLSKWVDATRNSLRSANRLTIGDQMIGQMLSGAPASPDGIWPDPAVCEVIDRIRTEHLRSGFRIGLFNSRGVVMRSMTEGGAQDRALARTYEERAKKIEARWPYTAAVLRELAETYERHARSEDIEVELRQDIE